MKRLFSLIVRPGLTGLLIAFSIILAACSSSASGSYSTPATPASISTALPATGSPALPATGSPVLPATGSPVLPSTGGANVQAVNNSQFGQILVTSDGKTLYTNTVDTPDNLRCTTAACTNFWVPYVVTAQPTAGKEITGSLGLVTRPGGSKQVTYNQLPLYTFYLDKQAGDVKGNGFVDFGGTWHVVSLSGSSGGTSTSGSNTGSGSNNNGSGGYNNGYGGNP